MKFLSHITDRLAGFLTGESAVPTQENPRPSLPAEAFGFAVEVAPTQPKKWPIDDVLIRFRTWDARSGKEVQIPFSYRDSYTSLFVFGGVGSGKTSGIGVHLSHAYLKAGMGGLVLCAKTGEADDWIERAKACGREKDLVIFAEGQGFNFLEYEMKYSLGSKHDAATEVLMELVGGSKESKDPVWQLAARRLVSQCLLALQLSGEPITLAGVNRLATDPKAVEALMAKAQARAAKLSVSEREDLHEVDRYLTVEWAAMAGVTRASVLMNLTSVISPFLTGVMRDCFTKQTTHTPDDIFAGKIIVCALSHTRYNEAGRSANVAWKYCFQRAALRRKPSDADRPTFLFADEAQYFVTARDPDYFQTARQSRCSTIFLTQSRPNLLDRISKEKVDSLLGCFGTKVFCNNVDPETNDYGTKLIGKKWQTKASTSNNYQVGGQSQGGGGTSYSQSMEDQLPPNKFSELATGGEPYRKVVTSYLYLGGRRFLHGHPLTGEASMKEEAEAVNYVQVGFHQEKIKL